MINFYKYLPNSKEDERWGLTVLNTGCTHIGTSNTYPFKDHPVHHRFDWNSWRILQEYQIIYITRGSGLFESETSKQTNITAGTIILLFPNERHRYKPDPDTGWDEYWVGVKGQIVDNLVLEGYFSRAEPTMYVGFNETIIDLFQSIIEKTKHERSGYQPAVSGAALHLLGTCHSTVKQQTMGNQEEQSIIDRAMLLFRSNINNLYSAEQAANDLCIGYSSFRKLFKRYTNLSPGQYYLQLKIDKAKDLLSNSNLRIKEISIELNFESDFYFSKLFKEKTGFNPTDYRKRSSASSSQTF